MDCGERSGEEIGEGRNVRRRIKSKRRRIKGAKSADVIIEHLKCTSILSYKYST